MACRTSQDLKVDQELVIDEITWRQFLNNALKKSHGVFGEGCEYYLVHQHKHLAYVKVFWKDTDIFSSALSTFISTSELVGVPMILLIRQITRAVRELEVEEDDRLWHKRAISEDCEDEVPA
ncbi:LADA_0F09164g1_1 [Lachancea dasiensis]|uniref:LADA_0F09164g1_1 n=1 Tax=Lachancea dasiensis TaxID=1072105 RepID=A0A1G4JLD0_9SACH|nr:LADA_0F09164g1_1 [Lachancea dasiensis]